MFGSAGIGFLFFFFFFFDRPVALTFVPVAKTAFGPVPGDKLPLVLSIVVVLWTSEESPVSISSREVYISSMLSYGLGEFSGSPCVGLEVCSCSYSSISLSKS